MIPAQHLITSIHTHWASQTAGVAPTIYPGTRLDTHQLDAWCELWVDAWSDPPRRNADPDRLTLSILVHCFSRRPADPAALARLVSAARAALARQAIPLQDLTGPSPISLGLLRVREHDLHDLSRNHAALGQEQLLHAVLVFQAHAEEAPPVA